MTLVLKAGTSWAETNFPSYSLYPPTAGLQA
ncbi:MAG: hypothetical protein RL205_58 [Actinomycetota bacterium]|jgi:hypothetical protein